MIAHKNNIAQTVIINSRMNYFEAVRIHAWRGFFLFCFLDVVNYKSMKWEPFSADWLRRQNLKTLRVQVPWWNGKQIRVRCFFLHLFIIFFLLKWDFLWNHFATQNVRLTFCVAKWVWMSHLNNYLITPYDYNKLVNSVGIFESLLILLIILESKIFRLLLIFYRLAYSKNQNRRRAINLLNRYMNRL